WINPQQTLFITTQFFYKHVFDSPGDLVLPVPYRNLPVSDKFLILGTNAGAASLGCATGPGGKRESCKLRPRFFHLADDRFLQTLLFTTSSSGGRCILSYGMLYDWHGALVLPLRIPYARAPF